VRSQNHQSDSKTKDLNQLNYHKILVTGLKLIQSDLKILREFKILTVINWHPSEIQTYLMIEREYLGLGVEVRAE
jgi:hypothetical protein